MQTENGIDNKYLIYGTDDVTINVVGNVFANENELKQSGCIGFITTDCFQKEFMSLPAYIMAEVIEMDAYYICIVNAEKFDVQKDHLTIGYGFNIGRIKTPNWLINLKVRMKYKDSSDLEIAELMKRITTCEDDFLGFCLEKPRKYLVMWDPVYDMPFIVYEGKRIYYPRNQRFLTENDKQYIIGVEYEQQKGSPHLYLQNETIIRENMVIVDAGVCEGNFAIKYIDNCKKMFLIEPSPDWYYPLHLTFKDYMNKVVFCDKYLSDVNDEKHITLDELVENEKIDFLKMDIEGCETNALEGARKLLMNNKVYCSICSYHKHDDQEKIENVLKSMGYSCEHSSGYMIYLSDPERFKYCELRRGVIYGWKDDV